MLDRCPDCGWIVPVRRHIKTRAYAFHSRDKTRDLGNYNIHVRPVNLGKSRADKVNGPSPKYTRPLTVRGERLCPDNFGGDVNKWENKGTPALAWTRKVIKLVMALRESGLIDELKINGTGGGASIERRARNLADRPATAWKISAMGLMLTGIWQLGKCPGLSAAA